MIAFARAASSLHLEAVFPASDTVAYYIVEAGATAFFDRFRYFAPSPSGHAGDLLKPPAAALWFVFEKRT